MNGDRLLSGAHPWYLRQNLRRVRVDTRVDMGAVNYGTYTPLVALLQPTGTLTATITSSTPVAVGADAEITLSGSDAAAAYGYTAGDAALVGARVTAVSTADDGYFQGTIKIAPTASADDVVVTVTVTAAAGAMAPSTTLRLAHAKDQLFLDRPKQSTTAANNLLRNVFMQTGRAHANDTMTFVLAGQHPDGSIAVDRAATVQLETDIDIAISESVGVGTKFTVYTTDATQSGLDSDAVAADYHRLAKFTVTGGVNAGGVGYSLKIQEDDSDIADPDAVAANHDVIELFDVSYNSSTETTTGFLGIRDTVAARSATMKSSVWLTARDDRDMNTQYTFTVRYCAPPTLAVVLNTDGASYIHDDSGTDIPAVLKGTGDQPGSEAVVADLTLSGGFSPSDDRSYTATVPSSSVFKFIDNNDGTLDLAFNPLQAQQVHDTGSDGAYTVTLTDHGRETDFQVNNLRARLFGSVSDVTIAVPDDANFVYVTETEYAAGGAIELGSVAVDLNNSGEPNDDIELTSSVGAIVNGKVQVNANTADRSGSLTTATVYGWLAGLTAKSVAGASVLQTGSSSFDFGLRRNPALSVAISSAAVTAETLKLKSGHTYVFEDPDTEADNAPIVIATVEVTNGRLSGGDTTTITHTVAGVTIAHDENDVYNVLIDPEVTAPGQVDLDAISETSGFQVVETIDGAGGVDSDRTAAVAANALFDAQSGLKVVYYAGDPDLQVSSFRSRTYDDYIVGSGSLDGDSALSTIATYRIHDTYVTNTGGVLSIPELRVAKLSSATWNPTEAANNLVADAVVGVANIADAQDGLHYTFDLVLKSTTGLRVSRNLAAADNHIWAYLTTVTADEATNADRAAGFAIEIVQPPTFTATAAQSTTTYQSKPAFAASSGAVNLYTVDVAAGVVSLPLNGFSKRADTDTDSVCELLSGTMRFIGGDSDKNRLLQAASVAYADFGISNLAAVPTVGSRTFDIDPPSVLASGFFVYKPLSLSLTPPAFPAGSAYTLQSHGSVYAVVAPAVAESVPNGDALRTTLSVAGGLGDYTLSLNIGDEPVQTYTASVAGTTKTFYLRDDNLAPATPGAGQTAMRASDTITIQATDQDLDQATATESHGSLRVFAPLEVVARDADDNSVISGQMNVYMAAGENFDDEVAVRAANLFRGGAWYMASTMSSDAALVAMSQGGKLQLTPTVSLQGGGASTALDMDNAAFDLAFNGDTSGLSVGTTNYGVVVQDQLGSTITPFDSNRWLSMRVYDDVTVSTVSRPVFKNASDVYGAFTVSATYTGGAPRGADGDALRNAFSVAEVTGLTVDSPSATIAVTSTVYDHTEYTDGVTVSLTPNPSAAASVFAGGLFRLTLTAAAISLGEDEYAIVAGSNPAKGSSVQLVAPATAHATLTFVDCQAGTANQAAAIFGDKYNAFLSGNADEYYLSNFGESDDPAINAIEIDGTPSTLVDGSSTTLSRGGTGALLINYGTLNDNSSRLALLHFQAPPTMPHAFMIRVENADGTHNTNARFYVANTSSEDSDAVITASGQSDDDQFFVGDIFGSDALNHASVATNGYATIGKASNKFISVDVSDIADASVVHLVVYAVNDDATDANLFDSSLQLSRIQAYVRQTGDLLGVDVPRDILTTSTFRDNDYTWSDHGSLVVPYSSIRMEPSSTSAAAFTFDVQVWAKKPGSGETTYHNLTDVVFARESEFAVGTAPTATGYGTESYVRIPPGSGNLLALKNLPERFMEMTSPSPFTADSSSQEWNTDDEANPNVITYRLALRKVEAGAVPDPQQWVYQEFQYKRASDLNADASSIVRSTSSNFKAASGGSAFNVQFLALTSSSSTIIGYYAKQMNSTVQSFQQVIVNQMSKVSAMMATVASMDVAPTPRTLADWLILFNDNDELAGRELYEDNVFFARAPGDTIAYNATAAEGGGTHDYEPDNQGTWSIVRIAPDFN